MGFLRNPRAPNGKRSELTSHPGADLQLRFGAAAPLGIG